MPLPSPWLYPRLIAHRGAGRAAPENTLAAMRLGASCGFAMMEYDVKLSKDGIAILLHDDDLERTSNGHGPVAQFTLAELAQVDFGNWHGKAYAGEQIATLHAVASFTRANDISSNIEIKPSLGQDAETGMQVARIASRLWSGAQLPPLLSSFSETALEAAKEEAPDLPRALLIEEALPQDWLQRVQRLACMGLNLNHRYTTRTIVEDIRGAGYTVVAWTVNDLARANELLEWGCDAVVTDEITALAASNFPPRLL